MAALVGALRAMPWWVDALAIAVASRAFSIGLIEIAYARAVRLAPDLWTGFSGPLGVWDGPWYLRIAESGYHAEKIQGFQDFAFFPLWPLTIKAASRGGLIPPDVAAAILANGLFLAASILVMRVFLQIGDRNAARTGLALLAFGPGAFTYSLIYSESLFLFLAAASFCTWGWGRIGSVVLATLTRPIGALLAVANLGEARAPGRRRTACLVAAAGVLTFLAWWGYIWLLTGDPLGYMRGTPAWKRDASGMGSVLDGPYGLGLVAVAYAVILLLGGIHLARKGHVTLGVYSVLAAGTAIIFGAWSEIPRYAMAAFPANAAVAWFLPAARPRVLLIGLAAALQVAWAMATLAGLGAP